MANFVRLRSSGMWTLLSVVSPSEFESIDDIRPKLINATDGSTHAPTTKIVIGGQGLEISGPFKVTGTGTLTVDASAWVFSESGTFQESVTFSDVISAFSATFSSTLTVAGTLTANGNTVLGNAGADTVTINATLTVGSTNWAFNESGTFQELVTLSGGFTASSASTFNAAATFNGQSNFNDPIQLSADANIRYRVATGSDLDATFNVSTCDIIQVPAGTLSANRNYTIGETGAVDGSVLTISRYLDGSGFTITLKRADTTTIATLDTAGLRAVKLLRRSGAWEAFFPGLAL